MPIADEHHPTRAQGSARPVRTTAVIVYATFLVLILTIPQSLVNWLGDMNDNPVQQVLLHAANGVQAASHRIGVDLVYLRARSAFRALAGKEED
jgi:hypothetical protein